MTWYKVLDANNHSCHGGSPDLVWSLPTQNADGSWTPGAWMPDVRGELEPCRNGYHLTDEQHIMTWLDAAIYEAEPSAEIVKDENKICCRSVRLLRKMTTWNEHTARLFACDCAEHVLALYEQAYPDDNRPRHAIEVVRLYLEGKATDEELNAARAAAQAVKRSAGKATWDAARATQAAAQNAAGTAAWAAAKAAAWDATQAVAGDAERAWQTARLMEYLRGER